MKIEQFIIMTVISISILLSGIMIYDKNYMFDLEDYIISRFNKKHNISIDKATYCRFEGMNKIKSATSLLILNVVCFLFEIKDFKTMIIILCIWGVTDMLFYNIRKNKFINML